MARQRQSNRKTKSNPKLQHDGQPSVFTCPDCQGTLFIVKDRNLVRFRCRIGHLYSPESMLEAQDDNVERLMWSAVRALEEQAEYMSQMSDQIGKSRDSDGRDHYAERSQSALHKAEIVRKLVVADAEERRGDAPSDL